MVCQFLLHNKVNQLYIYIYPHTSSLLHLPPTLPIPPLQVDTKHRADLHVLSGFFPLAIYFTFGSVYMSMPLSHFIPDYPSPHCVLKSILYICDFIPVLPLGSSEPFVLLFLDSIYVCQHTVFVFLFLTSLCMTVSMSIHLTTNNSISFLFMANIPLYIYTTSSLSIHLSMDIQVASMSWLL